VDVKEPGGFERWHLLFDALCRERGHHNNATLASELCARSGRNRREDFEAAKKQLRTWRSGRRLPLKRNVAALAQILEIDSDPELKRKWLQLYRREHAMRGGIEQIEHVGSPAVSLSTRGWIPARRGLVFAGLALAGGLGVALSSVAGKRPVVQPDLPIVNFEGLVRVPTGAGVLVHGQPGDCDGAPPDWVKIAGEMPASDLGKFADGGLARKVVRRCAGERVVRAVRFTGIEPGTDGVRLFGDYIRIDVVGVQRQFERNSTE